MTARAAGGLHGMKIRRAEDGFGPLGWDQDALPRPLREGQGRTGVALEVLAQGRDLVVRVTGGAAHVGAVAVCAGRSMADHAGPAGQVLVVPGHREGTLAAETAEAVARATGCTCASWKGRRTRLR